MADSETFLSRQNDCRVNRLRRILKPPRRHLIDSGTSDSSADSTLGRYLRVVGDTEINGSLVVIGDQNNKVPSSPASVDGPAIAGFEIGMADWSGAMFSDTG